MRCYLCNEPVNGFIIVNIKEADVPICRNCLRKIFITYAIKSKEKWSLGESRVVTLRLPIKLYKALVKESLKYMTSKSEVIRRALIEYFEKRGVKIE